MSAYTTHYTYDLHADEVWFEVRNRGRFVCRCRTEQMAQRIVRALERA